MSAVAEVGHAPWMKEFLKATKDDVLVNLLLTLQCNYQCAHCMYRSGPQKPKTYMSYDDLHHIGDFIQKMVEAGLRPTVNLVGGEPTLNMGEFHRCLSTLNMLLGDTQGVTFEMTTNGWWLRSWTTTKLFLKAVRDARMSESLCIRISDSDYHRQWRGKEAPLIRLLSTYSDRDEALRSLMEHWDEEERAKADVEVECAECAHCFTGGSCCPECAHDNDQAYYEVCDALPGARSREGIWWVLESLMKEDHLYVDVQGSEGMVPVGRARDNHLGQVGGHCPAHADIKFTFQPGGTLQGICCHGGEVPLGHASEGWMLFMRRIGFLQSLEKRYPSREGRDGMFERCENCDLFAAKWLKGKRPLQEARQLAVVDEIERITREEDLSEFIAEEG